MARLIEHEAVGPIEVKPSEQSQWICACGLTKTPPFCDGNHKLARKQEEEGKLYKYEGDSAIEIDRP